MIYLWHMEVWIPAQNSNEKTMNNVWETLYYMNFFDTEVFVDV